MEFVKNKCFSIYLFPYMGFANKNDYYLIYLSDWILQQYSFQPYKMCLIGMPS